MIFKEIEFEAGSAEDKSTLPADAAGWSERDWVKTSARRFISPLRPPTRVQEHRAGRSGNAGTDA